MFYFRFCADALQIIKYFLNTQVSRKSEFGCPSQFGRPLVFETKEYQQVWGNTGSEHSKSCALQWNHGPDLTYIQETGASDPNSPVILIKTWSCKTDGHAFFLSPFPVTTSNLYFRNTCEFLLHQGCSDKVAMLWFLLNAKMWHFSHSSLTQ